MRGRKREDAEPQDERERKDERKNEVGWRGGRGNRHAFEQLKVTNCPDIV